MTFDLEKAREAVHILENFAFASGKITTGQIQDILWGARQLAGASTEIERLRAELASANVELMTAGEIVGAKEARIKELEDAHKRSGKKYAKIINELRSSVYANIPGLDVGKIGPDASKSHLRPYEVVAADLAGRLAAEDRRKSWQITDERRRAIRWAEEMAGDCKAGNVLRAMLEESQ